MNEWMNETCRRTTSWEIVEPCQGSLDWKRTVLERRWRPAPAMLPTAPAASAAAASSWNLVPGDERSHRHIDKPTMLVPTPSRQQSVLQQVQICYRSGTDGALLHRCWKDVYAFTRQQHFSVLNDVMAASLTYDVKSKMCTHVKNITAKFYHKTTEP